MIKEKKMSSGERKEMAKIPSKELIKALIYKRIFLDHAKCCHKIINDKLLRYLPMSERKLARELSLSKTCIHNGLVELCEEGVFDRGYVKPKEMVKCYENMLIAIKPEGFDTCRQAAIALGYIKNVTTDKISSEKKKEKLKYKYNESEILSFKKHNDKIVALGWNELTKTLGNSVKSEINASKSRCLGYCLQRLAKAFAGRSTEDKLSFFREYLNNQKRFFKDKLDLWKVLNSKHVKNYICAKKREISQMERPQSRRTLPSSCHAMMGIGAVLATLNIQITGETMDFNSMDKIQSQYRPMTAEEVEAKRKEYAFEKKRKSEASYGKSKYSVVRKSNYEKYRTLEQKKQAMIQNYIKHTKGADEALKLNNQQYKQQQELKKLRQSGDLEALKKAYIDLFSKK